MTQWIPDKSTVPRSSNSGSTERKRTRAGAPARTRSMSAHGSARRRFRWAGTVASVNWSPPCSFASADHGSGIATGAPGRARSEYDATAVAPRPLRR